MQLEMLQDTSVMLMIVMEFPANDGDALPMSFPLTDFQMKCLATIRDLVVDKTWLPPSYVMAHVSIESGWDPTIKASDFSKTGSEGLMQVEAATVQQMIDEGFITSAQLDQTVPENSLAAGVAYIGWARAFLMKAWGFHDTLSYVPLCSAYNIGVGNVLKGLRNERYYLKWAAKQQNFAFVSSRP